MGRKSKKFVEINKISYELLKLEQKKRYDNIGEGTFGIVKLRKYKDVLVAVKLFKLNIEKTKKKVIDEFLIQNSLKRCSNIVKTEGWTENENTYGLVMEFMCGGSLTKWIEGVNYTNVHVYNWAHQIAQALLYMHTRINPIVHCDIKPGNMLLSGDGLKIKLTDFGEASYVQKLQKRKPQFKGTIAYMSPEIISLKVKDQQQNSSTVQIDYRKNDVYSWGKSFWCCFYRKKPFTNEFNCRDHEDLNRKKQEPLKFPNKNLSEFEMILSQSIENDPEKRLNISDIEKELDRLLEFQKEPDKIIHENVHEMMKFLDENRTCQTVENNDTSEDEQSVSIIANRLEGMILENDEEDECLLDGSRIPESIQSEGSKTNEVNEYSETETNEIKTISEESFNATESEAEELSEKEKEDKKRTQELIDRLLAENLHEIEKINFKQSLNKKIVVFGGFGDNGEENDFDERMLEDIEEFHGIDDLEVYEKWKASDGKTPATKIYFGCTELERKIYICGGRESYLSSPTNSLYESENDDYSIWYVLPAMNSVRDSFGFTGAKINGTKFLMAAGGYKENSVSGTVELLNLDNYCKEGWKQLNSTIKNKCTGLELVAVDDKIMAIGGQNYISKYNTVQTFDFHKHSWQINTSSTNFKYSMFGATNHHGSVYVCDGTNFEVLHKGSQNWVEIKNKPPVNIKEGLQLVSFNETIMAIGGRTRTELAVNTVQIYDPRNQNWSLDCEPMLWARAHHRAVCL